VGVSNHGMAGMSRTPMVGGACTRQSLFDEAVAEEFV
jgi:hypothetical protein